MSSPANTSVSLAGRTAIVITASDRCFAGEQTDLSGPAVAQILTESGAEVLEILIVPDEIPALVAALRNSATRANLILTTGGTGLSPRDVTPEATALVCERSVPGLAELIRQNGLSQTPYAALSRGIAGTSGQTLIINLPGSPAGAASSLQSVLNLLPHALNLLAGQTDHPA
jgi:molybdopterin adenylyltransferase